jgi:tetratricopeptide (TPR) repeat protein
MKHRKAVTISGTICLALFMFAGCGERSGEKEYSKAMAAWDDGDLVRARTLFEKSIRKTSSNEKKSVSWNQLGIILWNLQETEAAAEAFSNSCNLNESLSGADLNMGIALFHSGRYDESEVVFNNVLGNSPDNATALAILGIIEMQKRNWTGAVDSTSKAIQINRSDPASQNALALSELHINSNSEAAINRLKLLVGAHPDYAPAAYNLAAIYDQWLGNQSAAIGWYQQYLEKADPSAKHVGSAKQAIIRLGGKPPATRAPSGNSDPKVAEEFMIAGSKLQAAQKYTDAVRQYQQAVNANPNLISAHYNMGLAYYSLGKYHDAAQACSNALSIDPRQADARYMLSLSYYQLKRWDDSEREAKKLQQVDPKRAAEMLTYISNARK